MVRRYVSGKLLKAQHMIHGIEMRRISKGVCLFVYLVGLYGFVALHTHIEARLFISSSFGLIVLMLYKANWSYSTLYTVRIHPIYITMDKL